MTNHLSHFKAGVSVKVFIGGTDIEKIGHNVVIRTTTIVYQQHDVINDLAKTGTFTCALSIIFKLFI